jgi:hypothetical protein
LKYIWTGGDCDYERLDCWSDCRYSSTAVTGQCPGDDDEYVGKMVSILSSADLLLAMRKTKVNRKTI